MRGEEAIGRRDSTLSSEESGSVDDSDSGISISSYSFKPGSYSFPTGVSKYEAAKIARKRADYLLRRAVIDQVEAYRVVKWFFTVFVDKSAELTIGELLDELHKVYINHELRSEVYRFLRSMEKVEYEDDPFSHDEIKKLLLEFKKLTKRLVVERHDELPLLIRIINTLFGKKPVKKEIYISELPVVEENSDINITFRTLIEDVYLALSKGDKKRAAKFYKKAFSIYNSLSFDEQSKFYLLLKEAYDAITKPYQKS